MDKGVKNDANARMLHKKVDAKKLFEDSYLENSVQFNVVEIVSSEGVMLIGGIDDADTSQLVAFDSEIRVSCDEPIIKIHFSLEGTYSFQPLSHIDYYVQIPENHCNMCYCPTKDRKDFIFNNTTRIFEIYLKPSSLKELLGAEYNHSFGKLKAAVANSNSYVLWDKSKFIPPNLRSKINEIIQCPYKGEIQKKYLESKLTVLIIDFLMGRQTAALSKAKVKLLNADYLSLVKVEAHIRNNLKAPLKILDLAEIAGFNATKLKRDFKKVYGVPVYKYITALRMEFAKSLIIQENATIAQAAYEVGYSNPQHFTTAFKRTMGYLPSELKSVNS
ncbi:helix-turn-helix domain-containing protein [Kriegella sp. EG-1]|nr:helix-turn-helix domain-containing protein [Flavobacteriaceae bacterium EG-1]